ncbi:SDH family Clp fold serine proteinase [Pseudomonas putida]|uniref:SDH family Clp fold serine proteinase n=1 Tax=Pseudomonas putida TaxID=303 RepID=UPI00275B7064|nr:S49 family peptidase [Pseudomonas putida]MDP9523367.1 S49 family peptidase [Pseudomonas putida]
MPNWNDVLTEIAAESQNHGDLALDLVRRKYLAELSAHTGRNTIAYYSGWLTSNPSNPQLYVHDGDKNAFMTVVHGCQFNKGLDLILHTPGGDIAAAESLVDYLHQLFGSDIRVIVPQLAMSAGTMIACSAKSVVMGKQSSLGPIDPQIQNVPAIGVLAELDKAAADIKGDPAKLELWRVIIGKYHPTLVVSCEQAIKWAQEFVENSLKTVMFDGEANAQEKAKAIVEFLSDFDSTRHHSRHININRCREIGLKIEQMEEDDRLQDLILTVHHCYIHAMDGGRVAKVVENDRGVAQVRLNVT